MRPLLPAASALLAGTALLVPGAAFAQQVLPLLPTDTAANDVVVTGQRASQQRALDLKRRALGVVDVAAADEIGQLPDRNVAEVIERLPGVGVQYDQGEGRYVAVRGVPSFLNGYTVNGFEIGNPDGNTRRLPLDVISGQLLNRVEVAKVKTSDQDGQGIGGTINLVTQTAFDFSGDRIAQFNAQVGYQELNEKMPVRGDGSLGGRFGDIGIIIGGSYSKRTFQSAGLFPDDWAPVAGAVRGGLPINIKYTDYILTRERTGATGSLDWRPGGGAHRLHVRGIYSRFTEDEYRQRYRIDFANGGRALVDQGLVVLAPGGVTGSSTRTEQRSDLRLEYKEKSVLAGMLGGESDLGGWTADYGAARIHNQVIEPNELWQFRNNTALGPVDFDFTERLYTAAPRTAAPASNLQFRQYSAQDENGDEYIWTGRLDLRRDLALGQGSFVKLGLKGRWTDKSFDVRNDVYDRGSTANRFTLEQANAVGGAVGVRVREDRVYVIPVTIDPDAIRAFTAGRLGSLQFVRNNGTSLANETVSDTIVEEDVTAAYAMTNLDFGALALTAGVRLERTDLDIAGFRLQNGTLVVPARERDRYANLLPSLIGRFEPGRGLIVRAAWHRSLGRPEYINLSPGGRVAIEGNEAIVSLGNPALKPFLADNFDLGVEYYPDRDSLISAGLFAKRIQDPIFTQGFVVPGGSFAGTAYERVTFTQPLNGESATIRGLELAYQQQFSRLPGFLSGLGVNLNLTLVDSDLKVPASDGGTRTVGFPEQSDLLYGAQLFYQKGPFEARVAYHHTGRALLATGAGPVQDQYNDDLRRLDVKASYALSPRLTLFAEGQNLTDEPTRQYQNGRRDWVIQEERYGRAFWVGVSGRL